MCQTYFKLILHSFRIGLFMFQFVLLLCVWTVLQQLKHMKNHLPGLCHSEILVISVPETYMTDTVCIPIPPLQLPRYRNSQSNTSTDSASVIQRKTAANTIGRGRPIGAASLGQ